MLVSAGVLKSPLRSNVQVLVLLAFFLTLIFADNVPIGPNVPSLYTLLSLTVRSAGIDTTPVSNFPGTRLVSSL